MNEIEQAFLFSTLERLACSFESMARSLAGLNETINSTYEKQYPEQSAPREAVVSRVLTEEDKIKDAVGFSDRRPIREWIGGIPADEDDIGEREREFLSRKKEEPSSGAKASQEAGPRGAGAKEVGGIQGESSPRPSLERYDKRRRKRNGGTKSNTSGA